MEVEDAIRSRRTIKAFAPRAVEPDVLERLLALARWAPNHRITNPWRFRVVGPQALAQLKQVAAELARKSAPDGADADQIAQVAAAKLDRAPTLVACSFARSADPVQNDEDHAATAAAIYIVLLAAHARGVAGYWRTPAVLRVPEGLSALSIGADEQAIGLLHLGYCERDNETIVVPDRAPPQQYVSFLP